MTILDQLVSAARRARSAYYSSRTDAWRDAWRDVCLAAENALVAYANEQQRREYLTKAEAAAERATLLAQDQYEAGLVNFNNVLDAQRALLILQDQLAQSEGSVTSNLVRLYKALGGGWTFLQPAADQSNYGPQEKMQAAR